jgi:hypothetical protein
LLGKPLKWEGKGKTFVKNKIREKIKKINLKIY